MTYLTLTLSFIFACGKIISSFVLHIILVTTVILGGSYALLSIVLLPWLINSKSTSTQWYIDGWKYILTPIIVILCVLFLCNVLCFHLAKLFNKDVNIEHPMKFLD